MKSVIGLVLVLVGVGFGMWAGIYWAFIGGIVQVIDAIKATPTSGMDIAMGAARVFFFAPIGAFAAFVLVLPGAAMIKD